MITIIRKEISDNCNEPFDATLVFTPLCLMAFTTVEYRGTAITAPTLYFDVDEDNKHLTLRENANCHYTFFALQMDACEEERIMHLISSVDFSRNLPSPLYEISKKEMHARIGYKVV